MARAVDRCFSEADLQSITQAVHNAELKTNGELAVKLANRSKNWQLERIVDAVVIGLICLSAAMYLLRETNWGTYYNISQGLLYGAAGFVLAYFGWGKYLRRSARRQRIVWERARHLFEGLQPTRGHTGVLIFLSVEEDQAAIIADKAIASKLPADYWQKPLQLIVKAMRENRHAEGIVEAVLVIGEELSRHFPRTDDDRNELPDRPELLDR